jgi:hypothetical protein
MPAVPWRRDDRWLSLTPEPERLLPEARAILRSGMIPPPGELVERERELAERLVVSGRRAPWDAWLRETSALAAEAEEETQSAGALVRDVVGNHDALALGLPGAERLH